MRTVTRRGRLAATPRQRAVVFALLGAAAAAATDWGYRSLIASQGNSNPPGDYWSRVDFITVFMAGIAAAALSGAVLLGLRRDTAASFLLITACTGSAALGVVGIFSIGLALFVVAALVALAVSASPNVGAGWWSVTRLVPPVLSIGVLVIGINLTGGW
ncbi:MAG: hypothetical protein ACLQT7_09970 [Candidatus Dormibacteria bacterium]